MASAGSSPPWASCSCWSQPASSATATRAARAFPQASGRRTSAPLSASGAVRRRPSASRSDSPPRATSKPRTRPVPKDGSVRRRSRWSEASGPSTRSSRRSTGRAFPTRRGGEQAAEEVSSWANGAKDDLEEAEDLLDDEPDSLEDDVERVTEIARLIGGVLESGRQTLADGRHLRPRARGCVPRFEHVPATPRRRPARCRPPTGFSLPSRASSSSPSSSSACARAASASVSGAASARSSWSSSSGSSRGSRRSARCSSSSPSSRRRRRCRQQAASTTWSRSRARRSAPVRRRSTSSPRTSRTS